jgi:hypothetical protein
MSEFQDHPDIEKLPLEVEGFAVRETIREIFRDPENGTPDNISKAGCLVLANKGRLVWNCWRKLFPTKRKNGRYINRVDFSDHQFGIGEGVDFAGFQFGDQVTFRRTKWVSHANFSASEWGQQADFSCARWEMGADFSYANWTAFAIFRGAQWDRLASFECAKFGFGAYFSGAQWGQGAYFVGARLGLGLLHSFRGCGWETLRRQYVSDDEWREAQEWAIKRGMAPDELPMVNFSGVYFEGQADFSGRKFKDKTIFGRVPSDWFRQQPKRKADGEVEFDPEGRLVLEPSAGEHTGVIFEVAPLFHGCELHQDTTFDGAVFPKPSGNNDAARAYRTLKLAFSKQQAVREEQRFFRLEMEEETLRETGLKRWLFVAYKKFSDYGFSVVRPLAYGGVAIGVLTLFYGVLSWWGQCGIAAIDCAFAPQWLEFSLLQTLPLPGLDKLSEAASKAFWPTGAWWGVLLSSLVIVHKTISLAALFLVGLALRNLFKLK